MTLTCSERAKAIWARPGHREKMININKKIWETPEHREKMLNIYQSSEFREMRSKSVRELWKDPEFRKNMSQTHKELWEDPEFREKRVKAMQDPEYRKKRTELAKKMWANPEYREKMTKIRQRPEYRKKRSEDAKKRWTDPEFKSRLSGENAPNWQGGISKHPYPFEFDDELKQKIKERDGWKCILCPSRENLGVHHINYIKDDLRPENLITLCSPCHSKTNHNRDYWKAFLTLLTDIKEDSPSLTEIGGKLLCPQAT